MSASEARRSPSADRFYVGYRALPRAHRAALVALVPTLVIGVLALAGAMASAQRNPGDAVWDSAQERTWTGTLVTAPYPILFADDGTANLVVEMGKRGARGRELPTAPTRAQVRGFTLTREGRRIIELAPDADAITLSPDTHPTSPTPQDLGPVTLLGEIIDGKCYLGAMKPGDGKGHKACAILCIRGGLPPMVAGSDEHGHRAMRLLVVDGSTDLPERVLGLVAQPVEIRGVEQQLGPLRVVRASAGDIRPAP